MAYDFDKVIDRRGTLSEKWDGYPCCPHALPMWVADMDFTAPTEVIAALSERVEHGIFGYSRPHESSLEIAVNWRRQRCGHVIKPDWITFSSGVVCSIKAAIQAFTQPGDTIVVQTPVYPPFLFAPAGEGRRVARNPLLQDDSGWHMDFDNLEQQFKGGARLLLLCSSHNPVGRIWTGEELATLGELCSRYGVLVVSDEIHCDILRPGKRHTALAAMGGMERNVITLVSTTKSFNLAGLQNSVAITADPARKKQLEQELFRCNHSTPNLFGMIAQDAAWQHGGPWLDALNAYIAENTDRALEMLRQQQTLLPTMPEGTYLLWLDCRRLGLTGEALLDFFVNKCCVYPTMGGPYGAEGFVRLNLATRRALVEEGISRILDGLDKVGRLHS